ncbi:MAG: DHA2 family efflux MFS transporter permease subunit [Candidatus Eremiobacteraeota bacterium]|nr:DHA2 family efflux MFS transporter permease subunit [Candidatus Eremiobacteraeota bacterium]
MGWQPQRDRDTVESGMSLVIIVIGVMCATLMQTLDITIVNVALPTIQGNLGATQDEGAWVVTGYIISAVIVIPLTPWLQLRFGRRQYYGTAVIGFTIASIFCGTSSSIEQLIFWRIVQGLFGGGLVATAQATLRDTFPIARLGASQAIFAMGAIVGPSVGPTLGGWLTDNFSWNYVFFINIVPGTIAALIIFLRLKNPTDPKPIPVDGIGLGLLALGLGSLQYILDEGQRKDWFADTRITLFACLAAAALACFALWELFGTARPIVDLRAFKYRAIAAGSLLSLAMGSVLFGAIVILPQYTQGILGFTATLSGELIFVRALFIALLTPFIARLASSGRIDTRLLLFVGFSCIGIAQLWLGIITTTQNDFWSLIGPAILGGVGLSMLFTPISIAVLSAVPQDVAPKATAFQSLSLQLGGSFSTAALVTMLARREAFHQEVLASHATYASMPLQHLLHQHNSLAILYQQIIVQATTLAYSDAQYILGVLAVLLMPLIFVLPRRRAMTAAPAAIPAE